MKSIKELKLNYYFSFMTNLILILIISLGVIFLIINKHNFDINEVNEKILFYSTIAVIIITLIYFLYKFVVLLKDYRFVKNNKFEEIIGTVYRYAKNEAETGQQLNSHPIINVLGSNDSIELFVNKGTELNKTYVFIYLKYTRIAVVKEEYTENSFKTNN